MNIFWGLHAFILLPNSIFRTFKNCSKLGFSSCWKLFQIGLFEPFDGSRLLRILFQIGLFELVLKTNFCSNLFQIGFLHACLSHDKLKKGKNSVPKWDPLCTVKVTLVYEELFKEHHVTMWIIESVTSIGTIFEDLER